MAAGSAPRTSRTTWRSSRTDTDDEIAYPRTAVCIAARAARVPALDHPFFRFRDIDGLRRDALRARGMGFRGKFAIHPAQVQPSLRPSLRRKASSKTPGAFVEAFKQAEREVGPLPRWTAW